VNALFLQTADVINGGRTELREKLANGSLLHSIISGLLENICKQVDDDLSNAC